MSVCPSVPSQIHFLKTSGLVIHIQTQHMHHSIFGVLFVWGMYMFPPFPLLSKVMQKLRSTQVAEVILVASWWPTQSWFPHLLCLCVEHPLVLPYRRDLLSQQDQKYVSDGKSYHLHVWRLSCNTIKQQAFQKRSLGSRQPLGGPQPIACTTIGRRTRG